MRISLCARFGAAWRAIFGASRIRPWLGCPGVPHNAPVTETAESQPLDFDLEFGETLPPEPQAPRKRALIVSGDRDTRLYLRARLALAHVTQADEAETAAQVLALMREQRYDVAVVDFQLPDTDGWRFARQLREADPAVPRLIFTKADASWVDRLRARLSGLEHFFGKPPDPGALHSALQKV